MIPWLCSWQRKESTALSSCGGMRKVETLPRSAWGGSGASLGPVAAEGWAKLLSGMVLCFPE